MATSHRAIKPYALRSKEDPTSFENWRSNLVYVLRQDPDFKPFIQKSVTWTKKKVDPTKRGLSPTETKTAEVRADDLEQMLGCIANFCPKLRRKAIVEDSKSLEEVWQAIRLHYGFKTSGANFLDFIDIKLEPDERGEDLYQRMAAFIDDNLLKESGSLTHDGESIEEDEELTPTLENLIVLLWLEKLHPNLPSLVKQKYATELRTKTLYSLKPEISMAIPSLLEEAKTFEDAKIMRLGGHIHKKQSSYSKFQQGRRQNSYGQRKSGECPYCNLAGRNANHFLSQCKFLPDKDKKYLAKSRRLMAAIDDSEDEEEDQQFVEEEEEENMPERNMIHRSSSPIPTSSCRRVMIRTCPWMNVYYGSNATTITCDCGAEADLIRTDVAVAIGAKITKSVHSSTQVDGKTPLRVAGETHIIFTRGKYQFEFHGLVVDELDVEILGGVPFLSRNDILPRCATKEIILSDGHIIKYGCVTKSQDSTIRRAAVLIRAPSTTTIWPGEYVELNIPEDFTTDPELAIEPRNVDKGNEWIEPAIVRSVGSTIRIPNLTNEPKYIKRHDHIIQVAPTYSPKSLSFHEPACVRNVSFDNIQDNIKSIRVDPDNCLDPDIKKEFIEVHKQFNDVFDPRYSGYNHAFGKFEAVVNMGNVKPPQRKGKLPQYSRDKLTIVQDHFDKLESLGVLSKPEDLGVNIEYLNPSFLVKKQDGSFRLVTAFTEVGKYCKPQPTVLPTVDSTLRNIANWNYIITTDLKSAYYQIPLSRESMKYCGTASPFKGTRVYTRCAMGMPGSETALEELLCRILGDLITKGIVTKQADDLYVGGLTQRDLVNNWIAVLQCFSTAGIRLTAPKTIIAPKEAILLGWVWNEGKLSASPHKLASLGKCTKPVTVKEMRSFLGAYKVLARVIPKCASFLQPLSRSTVGKVSHSKIEWTEELSTSFSTAQSHLLNNKVINLPRESDQLIVVTDGATSQPAGIGSTLYVIRDEKPKLAGFFSQQLKPQQSQGWFPCEIEGLSIAAAVKFFSAYIIQSKHRTRIVTDSKPCVEAYNKLCRGEFSSNARLSTFLATVSRHHVTITHVSGAANLPSDFGSRNPVACDSDRCQVCQFVVKLDSCVVRSVSFKDVKDGRVQMPFTNRKAWLATQSECPDLRRVKAQLLQGTRPSKKETSIPNVKRYLNKVTIASDGLLVVRKADPLCPSREAIVVPAQVISGLITALHIRLEHPTCSEMLTIAERWFYALNLSKVIEEATKCCFTCAALAKIPKSLTVQSSSDPPETVGSQFACDVLRRERQMILVIREYVSSFTYTSLLKSERNEDLREGIIKLIVGVIPLDGPNAVVRVDPAPGFKPLVGDRVLNQHRINIDIGRVKNVNKNPVAEKAVQELEEAIIRIERHNETLDSTLLALVTARLNNRIRGNGLSAREVLMQRDQFSHRQIPIQDREVIFDKQRS